MSKTSSNPNLATMPPVDAVTLVDPSVPQIKKVRWSTKIPTYRQNRKSSGVINLPKKQLPEVPKLMESLSKNLSQLLAASQSFHEHLQNQPSASEISPPVAEHNFLDHNNNQVLEPQDSQSTSLSSKIAIGIGDENAEPSIPDDIDVSTFYLIELLDSLSRVELSLSMSPIMEYSKSSLAELNQILSSTYSNFSMGTIVTSVFSVGLNFWESAVGIAREIFRCEAEEECERAESKESECCEDGVELNGYSVRTAGSILSLNSVHMNLGNGKKMMIHVSLTPSSISSKYSPQILQQQNKWTFCLEGPPNRVSRRTGGQEKEGTPRNQGIIEIQPPKGPYPQNFPIQWNGPNEEGQILFELQ